MKHSFTTEQMLRTFAGVPPRFFARSQVKAEMMLVRMLTRQQKQDFAIYGGVIEHTVGPYYTLIGGFPATSHLIRKCSKNDDMWLVIATMCVFIASLQKFPICDEFAAILLHVRHNPFSFYKEANFRKFYRSRWYVVDLGIRFLISPNRKRENLDETVYL